MQPSLHGKWGRMTTALSGSGRGRLVGLCVADLRRKVRNIAAQSIKRRLSVVLGLVIGLQLLVGGALLCGTLISREALVSLYEDRLVAFQHLKAVNDGFALSVVEVAHKVRDGNMNAASGLAALEDVQPMIEQNWRSFAALNRSPSDKPEMAALSEAKGRADQAFDQLVRILKHGGDRDLLDFFVTGSLYSFIDPLFIAIAQHSDNQLSASRADIAATAAQLRMLLILSGLLAIAAILSALMGLRVMAATVVAPLEQLAGALGGDMTLGMVPGTERRDEIGQVARALESSMQRAAGAARLEREATEERRRRLLEQTDAERLRAEEQERQAERAHLLDQHFAAFQEDGVQLAKAIGTVVDRLRELSNASAQHARANLASVADAAAGSVQAAESVRAVACTSGRMVDFNRRHPRSDPGQPAACRQCGGRGTGCWRSGEAPAPVGRSHPQGCRRYR